MVLVIDRQFCFQSAISRTWLAMCVVAVRDEDVTDSTRVLE